MLAAAVPFALFGFGLFTTAVMFRADGGVFAALRGADAASAEAARAGGVLFLRALACGMVSLVFARAVEPSRLLRALMAQARLPAPLGYALFAALNVAPNLAAEIRLMRLARAMRAGRAPPRRPGPREALGLLIPLLAGAIRQATRTAIAMEARGLRRGRRPSPIGVPPFRPADAALLLLGLGLLAGLRLARTS